jgi:hypothetical protein
MLPRLLSHDPEYSLRVCGGSSNRSQDSAARKLTFTDCSQSSGRRVSRTGPIFISIAARCVKGGFPQSLSSF